MKTFLDAAAALAVLLTVYALGSQFVSLPDTNPYTVNSLPGSLLVIPIFFLIFYCLRSAVRHKRWYWFVGCLFLWPLSVVYYFFSVRKELASHAAQPAVPPDARSRAGARDARR